MSSASEQDVKAISREMKQKPVLKEIRIIRAPNGK